MVVGTSWQRLLLRCLHREGRLYSELAAFHDLTAHSRAQHCESSKRLTSALPANAFSVGKSWPPQLGPSASEASAPQPSQERGASTTCALPSAGALSGAGARSGAGALSGTTAPSGAGALCGAAAGKRPCWTYFWLKTGCPLPQRTHILAKHKCHMLHPIHPTEVVICQGSPVKEPAPDKPMDT